MNNDVGNLEQMTQAINALLNAYDNGGYADLAEAIETHERGLRLCKQVVAQMLEEAKAAALLHDLADVTKWEAVDRVERGGRR